ncbi:hypothetical protein SDC9_130648 [bioreactor metagenome]|uniref:Uncharacterized protein n=1 Tax=bioreactor metagenome TaxID=1076179 RepID=A0A645D2R5_9ZZZZ
MAENRVLFQRRNIKVFHSILGGDARVIKPVQPRVTRFVPVVQKEVVQQRGAHQFTLLPVQTKPFIDQKAKPSHCNTVCKAGGFSVLGIS